MYEYIVLSGGCSKGLAYIGVIDFLQEKNMLSNIKEYIGCSVGAFAALLMSLDYDSQILKDVFDDYNLDMLKKFRITTFFDKYGLDDGKKVEKFIKIFIKGKHFDENITLEKFHEKTNKKIVTVVTNINTKKPEFISMDNYPSMPLYLAVKMSMTIPFIYEPVKYNNNLYVDGGITCNFPVRYYYDILKPEERCKVLCFCFNEEFKSEKIKSFDDYLYNTLKSSFSTIETNEKNFANKNDFNIITIPVKIYTNFNLQLPRQEKEDLYSSGYHSISEFINKK